jgi:beta-lactamase superfamily II metal-dependent hydrolase
MSVIQYANLCGSKILLTGDAGRESLDVASHYFRKIGGILPGIDLFQVPHHGSRHNVSSDLLDTWLGKKLPLRPVKGREKFKALISASEKDENHPRKAVVRALMHRGAKVCVTKGKNFSFRKNRPSRMGWSEMEGLDYPDEQEE